MKNVLLLMYQNNITLIALSSTLKKNHQRLQLYEKLCIEMAVHVHTGMQKKHLEH